MSFCLSCPVISREHRIQKKQSAPVIQSLIISSERRPALHRSKFSRECLSWVKRRNTRSEHTESALPSIATKLRTSPEVRLVPCVDGSGLARAFFTFCRIGRCSHVFGLWMRFTLPLAIMPSADQVPVNNPHSMMRWHMWGVLIAGSTGSALRAVRHPNLHITPVVRRDLVYRASAMGSL